MACSTTLQDVVATQRQTVFSVSTQLVTRPGATNTVTFPTTKECDDDDLFCTPTASVVTTVSVHSDSVETETVTLTSVRAILRTTQQVVGTSCAATTTSASLAVTSSTASSVTSPTSRFAKSTATSATSPDKSPDDSVLSTSSPSTSLTTALVIKTVSAQPSRIVTPAASDSAVASSHNHTGAIVGGVVGSLSGAFLLVLIGLGLFRAKGPFARLSSVRASDQDSFDDAMWRPEEFQGDEDGNHPAPSGSVRRPSRYSKTSPSSADDELMREHHRRLSTISHESYRSSHAPYHSQSSLLPIQAPPDSLQAGHLPRLPMRSHSEPHQRLSVASSYSDAPVVPLPAATRQWQPQIHRHSSLASLQQDPGRPLHRQASAPTLPSYLAHFQLPAHRPHSTLLVPLNAPSSLPLTRTDSDSTASSRGPVTPTLPSQSMFRLDEDQEEGWDAPTTDCARGPKRTSKVPLEARVQGGAFQAAHDKLEGYAEEARRLFVVNADEQEDKPPWLERQV